MKVLLSGGGTAGHINPALAIAGHLSQNHQADILFVGTKKGLENKLVPAAGWDIRYIEVSGLIRRLTLKNLSVIKQFLTAIIHAKKILKDFAPDVVIGTGGYVCAPVLFAAKALKIPTIIHEQNVIPGVTVKLAAGLSDRICISFSDTTKYLKKAFVEKCVLTGNPIREEMFSVNSGAARKALGLDERPFVTAFGGSLGAATINNAVLGLLNGEKTDHFQFMLGTGQRFYEQFTKGLNKKEDNIRIVPYIENMDLVMAAADVIIGRAGALTVSELCALGKPAILVPSPNVAHDHQTHNAKSMEKIGGAIVIADRELSPETLKKAIDSVLDNEAGMAAMAENARRAGITDGAKRISDVALSLLK
ncbi:MAG: undecaprenyldiphospho-muramoylpentapeptide beta-N-acetylglucosaminyltransferase [Clostridia bacterium]|nr:undecaprenyldiphospho-muramoylpentapeptide beta-N-acetylglucosaminyltransferase [Clostridia bacterium]